MGDLVPGATFRRLMLVLSMFKANLSQYKKRNSKKDAVLLLETDCPRCEYRASHAGFEHVQSKFVKKQEKKFEKGCCVKGRYELCHII